MTFDIATTLTARPLELKFGYVRQLDNWRYTVCVSLITFQNDNALNMPVQMVKMMLKLTRWLKLPIGENRTGLLRPAIST